MWCPDCYGQFACPCKHCRKRDTENKKTWIIDGEDIQSCPDCGYSAHLDGWMDIEMEQYTFMRLIGFINNDEAKG